MENGRNCGNCDHHLEDDEYESYGSWSYECQECGFEYNHGHSLNEQEQVEEFEEED